MARIIWTEPALQDLDAMADYISLDKPVAAKRFVRQVFERIELLAKHPESGSLPAELYETAYSREHQDPDKANLRKSQNEVGMALRRRPWPYAERVGQRRSAVPTPRLAGRPRELSLFPFCNDWRCADPEAKHFPSIYGLPRHQQNQHLITAVEGAADNEGAAGAEGDAGFDDELFALIQLHFQGHGARRSCSAVCGADVKRKFTAQLHPLSFFAVWRNGALANQSKFLIAKNPFQSGLQRFQFGGKRAGLRGVVRCQNQTPPNHGHWLGGLCMQVVL